nr:S8/S53 family peptidase [uncultured Caldimonas sp.]
MSNKNPLADAQVELVRLDAHITAAAFETSIRAQLPDMVGSLLAWTHDDWFALAPDVAPALRKSGLDVRGALTQAGAIGFNTLGAEAYAQLALMRDVRGRTTPVPPAAPGTPIDVIRPPTYWREGWYQGRQIKLDWHVVAAGLPGAWAELGADGPGAYADIKVGHIDTGYTEHPALGFGSPQGTWLLPQQGVNYWRDKVEDYDTGEGPPEHWNAPPEYPGPRDNHTGSFPGHGTRTCSVLCGLYAPQPPIDYPFFGAAPGVPVIPYRITDSVLIDHVQDLLAKAIGDAVAKGARVISISLGAARRSKRVAKAVTAAYRQGVIICAAAGNTVPPVIYPGRFNCVVTLGGATTSNGVDLHPWRGASRGPAVDVSGPADAIRRPTTVMTGGRESYRIDGPGNGTSFATALCAGIAALWLARRRTDLEAAYGAHRWAHAAAFKKLVVDTAHTPPGWNQRDYGRGVYQADALLKADLPTLGELTEETDA